MTMNVSENSLRRRWSLGLGGRNEALSITARALPVFHAHSGGDFPTAAESEGKLGAALANLGGMPQSPLGGWPKRAADVAIALSALILAAPVMIVVAALIKLTTGGPAMYSHSRVGFNGKPFNCYKFRSMVANSDQVLREHLANNPEAAREWEEKRKLTRDPRITLLGTMLRKSSLDELPQLFNILRGDMSCVGPRPIVTDELKRYGDKVGEYLRTRPGLTGLWQVTGRSSTDYDIRVSLDSQYVQNWSLWADFVILVRTTTAVIRFGETS